VCFLYWPQAMDASTECRKMAELLRETAKAMHLRDTKIRAEYAYLIRGLLRLASQIEQDKRARAPNTLYVKTCKMI
jgi:hypothetical protein